MPQCQRALVRLTSLLESPLVFQHDAHIVERRRHAAPVADLFARSKRLLMHAHGARKVAKIAHDGRETVQRRRRSRAIADLGERLPGNFERLFGRTQLTLVEVAASLEKSRACDEMASAAALGSPKGELSGLQLAREIPESA